MGVFLLAGEHNNRPYYRQKHTVDTEGASFLYSHDNGGWVVSDTLGGAGGYLRNISQTASVPTSGWQYLKYDDDGWHHDPALTVTPLSALSSATCSSITISAKGEAAKKVPDYLGTFTPTGDYSAGRQVFSSDRGRYLMMKAGWSSWGVQDTPLNTVSRRNHEVATSVRAEHLSAMGIVSGGGEGAQTLGLLPSGLPLGRDGDVGADGRGEVRNSGHRQCRVMFQTAANPP